MQDVIKKSHPVKNINKLINISVVILLLLASFMYALNFMRQYSKEDNFGSKAFAPAVYIACGRGFINSRSAYTNPQFSQFLKREIRTYSCDKLPKILKPTELTFLQVTKYYFILFTGYIWKFFGISWDNLFYISALFFALSMMAVYLTCRLAMGITVALGVSLLFGVGIFSDPYFFTNLHDFCMAPFFLWYLYFMCQLVKMPFKLSRHLILALLAGLTLGFGLGFTVNFMIYIPLFVLTVFLFTSEGITKRLPAKILISIVYCGVIFIVAYPVFIRMAQGNNLFQNAIQGLSEEHIFYLYLQQSPLYEVLTDYTDSYVRMVLTNYANHIQHITTPISLGTALYTKAGIGYLGQLIKYFPGDLLLHGVASFFRVISLPYVYLLGKIINFSYLFWVGMALSIMMLGLAVLRNYSIRIALFALSLILFLGFYPAIQYEERHVFFLTVISLWMLGLLVNLIVKSIANRRSFSLMPFNLKGTIAFLLAPTALILTVLLFAFAWQKHQVTQLFSQYDSAKLEKLKPLATRESYGMTTIILPTVTSGDMATQHTRMGYLMVGLDLKRCEEPLVFIEPWYWPSTYCLSHLLSCEGDNLLHIVKLATQGTAKVFIPVYDDAIHRFAGIQIPTTQAKCITSLAKVKRFDQLPLQLTVWMPHDWRSQRMYQRISKPKAYSAYFPNTTYTAPAKLTVNENMWKLPLQKPESTFRGKIVNFTNNMIQVKGKPKIRFDYLVLFKPRKFTATELAKANYYFIVEGVLYYGGFTIGFIENKRWVRSSIIDLGRMGDFRMAIKVTKPGVFKPTIANFLEKSKNNRIKFSRYGWLQIKK